MKPESIENFKKQPEQPELDLKIIDKELEIRKAKEAEILAHRKEELEEKEREEKILYPWKKKH